MGQQSQAQQQIYTLRPKSLKFNSIKLLLLKVDAQATESSGVFSFLTGLYFYILSLVILRASVNCSMLILYRVSRFQSTSYAEC